MEEHNFIRKLTEGSGDLQDLVIAHLNEQLKEKNARVERLRKALSEIVELVGDDGSIQDIIEGVHELATDALKE